MKRKYEMGLDNNQISIEVTVGTPGVAYSVANSFRSGGQKVTLAESNTDTGSIPVTSIGAAGSLRNSYMVVQTMIDFGMIDPNQWDQLIQNLVIKYHLAGGFSGDQYFDPDPDDIVAGPNKKLVVVTKPIELI